MKASAGKSLKKASPAKLSLKKTSKTSVASKAPVAKKMTATSTAKKTAAKPPSKVTKAVSAVAKKPIAKVSPQTARKAAAKPAAIAKKKIAPKKVTAPTTKSSVKSATTKKVVSPIKKTTAALSKAKAPSKTTSSPKQIAKTPSRIVETPAKIAAPVAKKKVLPTSNAAPKITPTPAPSQTRTNINAVVNVADKVNRSVVSKVSEVINKTSKLSPSSIRTDGTLITEAELLKMGEKDYMNADQLAFFKARLQQLEKDLLKNAGETTEHLRETVLVPDPADRATIEEEHALELRTRDRERKLLKKVQQSIASIDAGEYGWCEETGEAIGVQRLMARPTATLSLEAQQRRELKQKLYGD